MMWYDFWLGVVGNIVADLLCLIAPIVAGLFLLHVTRRRQLLRFFGAKEGRRIVVYLSNLRVTRGGALGADGRPRSYQGQATPFGEMQVAHRFQRLFSYPVPTVGESPGLVSKLLVSDVRVDIRRSPLETGDVERSAPFITLGSPAYSAASGFVQTYLRSKARFALGRRRASVTQDVQLRSEREATPRSTPGAVQITSATAASGAAVRWMTGATTSTVSTTESISPRLARDEREIEDAVLVDGLCGKLADPALGFVERLADTIGGSQRHVFYAAGLSEVATAGAARFLATRWRSLDRKYPRGQPFVVVLRFAAGDSRRWTIVHEAPGPADRQA